MKQNPMTEEVKPQIGKEPVARNFPFWLATSLGLFLVSWVSLLYYFFRRGSKPKPQGEGVHPTQSKHAEPSRQGLDIIRDRLEDVPTPICEAPADGQPSIIDRIKSLTFRFFPSLTSLTAEQWKLLGSAIAAPFFVLGVIGIAQLVFDSSTMSGGLMLHYILFAASILFFVYFRSWILKWRTGASNLEAGSGQKTIIASYSMLAILLALVFSYAAQGVFDSIDGEGLLKNLPRLGEMTEANRLWIGTGIYFVCMALWVAAAPVVRYTAQVTVSSPSVAAPSRRYFDSVRSFLLYAAIGLYLMSMLLEMSVGENALIRGLWAAGLVSFILSQLIRLAPRPGAEESPRFQWRHWLILTLILGVAFWLRYYRLTEIPNDFHGDMAIHGGIAREYLLGVKTNIFGYDFYSFPFMSFLPAAFSMAVFGNNLFGLQMTSVIGGMLNLLAVYLFVWRAFDSHRLAALTTSLTAINVAHIHFSRIVENMDPWTFGVFALFFLMDGLKARRAPSFGLAGVFLGISLQMYFSGRVLVFIIGAFLAYAFFFKREWVIQNRRNFWLLAVGVLLAIGPALVSHATHWEDYVGRSRGVFIFNPEAMDHLLFGYETDSKWVVLLTQIKRSLLMFNQTNDTSGQFGYPRPMFNALVSPLIVLGLGVALRRWKEAGMAFMLIWLGMIVTLGSILTIDPPFWPRLVGVVPAAAFLAAVALDQILELTKNTLGLPSIAYPAALAAVFLLIVGGLNWTEYYRVVRENGTPPSVAGRFIARLPEDVAICGIFSEFRLSTHGTTAFLAGSRKLIDIEPDAPDSELEKCPKSPVVWIVSPENTARLDVITARWKNGILQEVNQRGYTLTFYLVGVEPPAPKPAEPTDD